MLLALVAVADRWFSIPGFGLSYSLRVTVLVLGAAATVIIIVWAQRALPVSARGTGVCTKGPFRWVRHPLYASFLSILNFALAIYLDSPSYVLWALALHPLWHWLIRYEERLMEREFGDAYQEYARHTGRFVPRLINDKDR